MTPRTVCGMGTSRGGAAVGGTTVDVPRRRGRAGAARAGSLGGVTLRLYDTADRELRAFTPLEPGRVGLYICGRTVQGRPHIGHVRFAVEYDVLRRWRVAGHGYDVTLVRNGTDI